MIHGSHSATNTPIWWPSCWWWHGSGEQVVRIPVPRGSSWPRSLDGRLVGPATEQTKLFVFAKRHPAWLRERAWQRTDTTDLRDLATEIVMLMAEEIGAGPDCADSARRWLQRQLRSGRDPFTVEDAFLRQRLSACRGSDACDAAEVIRALAVLEVPAARVGAILDSGSADVGWKPGTARDGGAPHD